MVIGKEYFAEEFKLGAVRQVIEHGFSVANVAKRLGVSAQSLYKWVRATQHTRDEKISGLVHNLPEPMKSMKF